MLNLGLESRRNRFGAAIVKAVLLFILRCRLHMDVTDRESSLWPPRPLLLGLSVVSLRLARPTDMDLLQPHGNSILHVRRTARRTLLR